MIKSEQLKGVKPTQPLVIRGLILGVLLFFVAWFAGTFSINPGIGQGQDFSSDSLRYRLGVELEMVATPMIVFCSWPVLILMLLGLDKIGEVPSFFCSWAAGISYLMAWDTVRNAIREKRKE